MDTQITKTELAVKLNKIISDALRIAPDKISGESRIIIDLNAESLDLLDIRFSIEQELGLQIGEKEFIETIGKGMTSTEFGEKFTVTSLVDFIEDKIKNSVPVQ